MIYEPTPLLWASILALLFLTWLFIRLMLMLIYFAQIKEYRPDRIMSQVRESGYFNLLQQYFWWRPAVSVRNILIIIFTITLTLLGLWVSIATSKWWEIGAHKQCLLLNGTLRLTCTYFNAFEHFTPTPSKLAVLSFFWVNILIVAAHILTLGGAMFTEPLARIRRKHLIQKAHEKITGSNTIYIVISGSYGKTTTKELLYHILSQKFQVGKTQGNMNTDVGVAISILKNVLPQTQYFIAEVGGYRRGEVADATNIFSPTYAIMTPFGNQHLSLYGSRENLVATESEAAEAVGTNGRVYVNADIAELPYIINHTRAPITTYSIKSHADIYATNLVTKNNISYASISYNGAVFDITYPLIGEYIVQNLMPAIALAIDLGMKPDEIQKAISTIKPIPGKLSRHKGVGESTIINDSANSSLDGFLNAIAIARKETGRKIIFATRGIIELGSEKETSYQQLLNALNDVSAILYTTDKLFNKLGTRTQVLTFNKEGSMIDHICKNADKNTTIVLEGRLHPNSLKSIIIDGNLQENK